MRNLLMNARKGQSMAFVVIGITIVLVMVLLFMLTGGAKEGIKDIKKTFGFANIVEVTQDFVKDCVTDTLKDGVKIVSLQGGYYKIPENRKFDSGDGNYVYFYGNGENIDKISVEKEILGYVRNNIDKICDFSRLKGFNVNAGEFDGNIIVENNNVILRSNWEVNVEKGNSKGVVKNVNVEANVRLGLIINNVNLILSNVGRSYIDISDGLDVRIIDEEGYWTYIIKDRYSFIDKKSLSFAFSVKK